MVATVAIVKLCMISREDGGLSKPQESGSLSLQFHFAQACKSEFYGGRLDIEDELDIQAGLGPVDATVSFVSNTAARTIHPGYTFTIRYPRSWLVGFGFVQSMICQNGSWWVTDSCELDPKWDRLMSPDYLVRPDLTKLSPGFALPRRDSWLAVEEILPWPGIIARLRYDTPRVADIKDGYGPKLRFEWGEKLFDGIHFYKDDANGERRAVIKFPPLGIPGAQMQEGDKFEIIDGDDVVGHGVVTGALP